MNQLATFDTKKAAAAHKQLIVDGRIGVSTGPVAGFVEGSWLAAAEPRIDEWTLEQYAWAVVVVKAWRGGYILRGANTARRMYVTKVPAQPAADRAWSAPDGCGRIGALGLRWRLAAGLVVDRPSRRTAGDGTRPKFSQR